MLDLNVTGGATLSLSPLPLPLSLSLSKTHFLTMCEFMLDLNDTGGLSFVQGAAPPDTI